LSLTQRTEHASGALVVAEGGHEARLRIAAPSPPAGIVRRVFTTYRHVAGFLLGGLVAHVAVRRQQEPPPRGAMFALQRTLASGARVFVDRSLVDEPLSVQLRRRLELLGPTFIKLGQILSLREDLFPPSITIELRKLLDQQPAVPFAICQTAIAADLGRDVDSMFLWVDPEPLASASIAQTHRATTRDGDSVILKIVKPGIPEILRRDAVLLKLLGYLLQPVFGRYQPRRIIAEFTAYTLREVDLRREADNAETFAANFRNTPDIVFPRIYRRYSGRRVLCMEFLEGIPPNSPDAARIPEDVRDRVIDLGAFAIIQMLYRDGFFHADLHPANLLILPGARCGFIDLGMVGRFDEELRRALLYYYYCLVTGDSEHAARYLAAVAHQAPGADVAAFRREVEDLSRRWIRSPTFHGFSLGRLILESVSKAGHFRLYFPVEMVLMVKALVTFEGVGQMLKPGLDIATISRKHVSHVFMARFAPMRMVTEALRDVPEVIDALVKTPLLVTEGVRVLEKSLREPADNPFSGVRGALLSGFCLIAGAILAVFGGPWPAWLLMFVLAALLAFRKER
jgi:ubiquinone biosynthesis protein